MATSEGVPVVVPQMGVVEEVLVLEWLVDDGEEVTEGQSLVVLETDKAETELTAPISGRIDIVIQSGDDEIPVGTTLARVT